MKKKNDYLKDRRFIGRATPIMLLYLFLCSGYGAPAFAVPDKRNTDHAGAVQQSVALKGTVTDRSGSPLAGASVLEKGTTNGTTTDVEGQFTLTVKNSQSVLLVSYIGYTNREITAGSRTNLEIVLEEAETLMDEIVVIGYGTQRKGDVTSAVASVKAEDFITGKIGDAAELVKGKIAGLNITKSSGDPNAQSAIMLRGVSTLNGNTYPLILIDGVPGDIQTIAPENIESIDVLKDASAAAIYGTRGSNGVILITTKAGKRESGVKATYTSYYSTSDFLKTPEMMSPGDIRRGLTAFSDGGWDTDWLAAVTQNGMTNNQSLSIEGGTKTLTYSTNMTYRKETGTIKKTDNEEIRLQLNLSQKLLDDKLTVGLNLMKGLHKNTNSNSTNSDQTNIFRQALIHNPTSPIYNEDGSYYEEFDRYLYYNPVSMINERIGEWTREWTYMIGNITVEPVKGWKTNLLLSRSLETGASGNYETEQYYASLTSGHKNGASRSYSREQKDNLELTTRYNFNSGVHRASVLAGYSYNYNVYDGFNAWNQAFPTDVFLYNNLSVGTYLKEGKAGMGSYKNDNKLISFLGRMTYGYDDRYNIMANVRREGSSRFGANHKWGLFYGISGSWNIMNEAMMHSLRETVNNLKLRVGYGMTGQNAGANYASLIMYDYSGGNYMDKSGSWVTALAISQNPNPNLKWETTSEINVGLEFGMLNERLSGAIDIYQRRTDDLLYWYDVPVPPNLYGSTLANVGSIQNRGIEVSITAIPVRTKDIEWSTTLTASHNQNKLLSLSNDLYQRDNWMNAGGMGEPISAPTHRVEVNKGMGNIWGLKAVGVTEDGHWLIEDPNTGNALIYTTVLNDDHYRQHLGNGIPKLVMGWGNTLRYKGLDLTVQTTGKFGFQIINEARAFYENNSIQYNKFKSAADPVFGIAPLANNQQQAFVSYYVEDGDYLKLDNITLGYTYRLSENKYVRSIRAYVSGQNVLCFTGYSGLDPELNAANFWSAGLDPRDKYPTIRSFTFGLNINF